MGHSDTIFGHAELTAKAALSPFIDSSQHQNVSLGVTVAGHSTLHRCGVSVRAPPVNEFPPDGLAAIHTFCRPLVGNSPIPTEHPSPTSSLHPTWPAPRRACRELRLAPPPPEKREMHCPVRFIRRHRRCRRLLPRCLRTRRLTRPDAHVTTSKGARASGRTAQHDTFRVRLTLGAIMIEDSESGAPCFGMYS